MLVRAFQYLFGNAVQATSAVQTQIAIAVAQEVSPNLSTISKQIRSAESRFELNKAQLNNNFAKWQREFAAEPSLVAPDYFKYLQRLEKQFSHEHNRLQKKKSVRPEIESTIDYIDAVKNLEITRSEMSRVQKYLAPKQKSSTRGITHNLQPQVADKPLFTSKVLNLPFSSDGIIYRVQFQGNNAYFVELLHQWPIPQSYKLISAHVSNQNIWTLLDQIQIPGWIDSGYSYLNFRRPTVSMVISSSRAYVGTNVVLPYDSVGTAVQVFDVSDPNNLKSIESIRSSSISESFVDLVPSAKPDFVFAAVFNQDLNDAEIDGLQRFNISNANFSVTSFPESAQWGGYQRIVIDETRQYLAAVHEMLGQIDYDELHIYKILDDEITPALSIKVTFSQNWRLQDLVLAKGNAYVFLDNQRISTARLTVISLEGHFLQGIYMSSMIGQFSICPVSLAASSNHLYLLRDETRSLYVYEMGEKTLEEIGSYAYPNDFFISGPHSMTISGADILIGGWGKVLMISQEYNIINCKVNITHFGEPILLTRSNFNVSGTVDPAIVVYQINGWDVQILGQPYGQFVRNFTQEKINQHVVYGIFYNNAPTTVSVIVPRRNPVICQLQLNYSEKEPAPAPKPSVTSVLLITGVAVGAFLTAVATFGCYKLGCFRYCARQSPGTSPAIEESDSRAPEVKLDIASTQSLSQAGVRTLFNAPSGINAHAQQVRNPEHKIRAATM